jgi:hypothetical protein
MFEDKKILFFSASFFGYQNEIKNKLALMGAHVDFYDERPKNTFLFKSLSRVDKRIVKIPIEKYYRDIITKTKDVDYDYVFFLKAELITLKVLKELKSHQEKAKFILYLWDSIADYGSVKDLHPIFDKILSFDFSDTKKYSFLSFRPLFYLDTYSQTPESEEIIKNDIIFIGTAHLDRYPVLKRLRDYCSLKKIKTYFFIYLQDRKLYYIWKFFSKDFRKAKKSDFSFSPLNKEEIKAIIQNSNCVLDVEKSIQSGLTMRAIEVLGARKKLITTNKAITEYDFYNENNILVIDRNNPIIPEKFIQSAYTDIEESIYKKYSLEYWLKEVFK